MTDATTLFQRFFSRRSLAFLVFSILNYILGVGISRYQGIEVNWSVFVLGLLWMICLLLGFSFVYEFFDLLNPRQQSDLPKTTAALIQKKKEQSVILTVGLALLSIAALFGVFFYRDGYLHTALVFVIFIGLSLGLVVVLPPFRQILSGFHELISGIILTNLIPAVGFLLQTPDFSRLVPMSTFPLTALFLVLVLAYEFPEYAHDCKICKPSLLYKVNWQNGVRLIYVLSLAAYLLIGYAYLSGMAWRLVWPFLLTSPLAAFVIYQINLIENGAKPNWRVFTISATALYLLAGYFISYSFWTA